MPFSKLTKSVMPRMWIIESKWSNSSKLFRSTKLVVQFWWKVVTDLWWRNIQKIQKDLTLASLLRLKTIKPYSRVSLDSQRLLLIQEYLHWMANCKTFSSHDWLQVTGGKITITFYQGFNFQNLTLWRWTLKKLQHSPSLNLILVFLSSCQI